jgi:hypothetical protein
MLYFCIRKKAAPPQIKSTIQTEQTTSSDELFFSTGSWIPGCLYTIAPFENIFVIDLPVRLFYFYLGFDSFEPGFAKFGTF